MASSSKATGNPMVLEFLSIEWILECINQRQPVYEEPFTIKSTTHSHLLPSSPLSQKGLTLLQYDTSSKIMPPPPPSTRPRFSDVGNQDQDVSELYMDKRKSNAEEDTLAQLLKEENFSKMCTTKKTYATTSYNNNTTKNMETSQEDTFCALFEGKTFKIISQTDDDVEKLTKVIEDHEGDIIPSASKTITDYIVVPSICNPLKHTATEVVNNLWIYECNARQELVPLEYYHQPIYKSTPLNVLENCVITISGYLSYERTYLMNLIQYLGGIYQDKFARLTLPDQSVLGSTHLICFEASGSKYQAAMRWQRPAISHKWLLRCAELKTKCDESQFLLTENNPSNTTHTVISNKRERISPIPQKEEQEHDSNQTDYEKSGKRMKSDESSSSRKMLQFDEENNDNDNDNVSLLCSGNNQNEDNNPKSPEITVDDGRKVSLNKFMKELRDQGLFQTPSPPPKLNAGTPITEVFARLRKEGKIPTKLNVSVTPERKYTKELPDAGSGGSGSQSTPIGRYLRSLQERNVIQKTPKSETKSSNANNSNNESPVVRPFYDIKTPETPLGRFLGDDDPSKETRKHWQRYIDTFPHYKCHDRPPATTQRRPSTPWSEVKKQAWAWLLRDKTTGEPEAGSSKDDDAENNAQISNEQSETQRLLSNQIDQIQDKLRQQNKSGNSRSSILHLDGSTPQKIASDNEQYASKIPALHDVKDSQANTVEWDDPIDSNIFDGHMSGEISNNFTSRKFMLSALEQSVRSTCTNTIKSLGGEVSEKNHYDHSATHVVCSNPTRNEKILASMASGKWIVHYKFIEESGQSGRFLNEEFFEYGNPKSLEKLSNLMETTPTMEAMHWWRLRALEMKQGAFHGMRALVFSKSKDAIVRLIEAGDGVILNAEPPFDHNLDVTHCFIDLKLKMDPDIFIPLAEQGIKCLNVLYLSNFLNHKTNINTNEYIIAHLKEYYK